MSRLGHAMTYISQAVTNKFYVVDRAMFALSPYLTFEEAEKIAVELERMATSKHEGNFSNSDAFNWLAQQLGPDRYQAVQMLWTLDNQLSIKRLYAPEQLRQAWVHKLTMTEGTPEEVRANPSNYIEVETLKSEYQ